ncbi:olfactory receptor 14A16-like [Apteryx mantelli]|uniref:Olfactory receptor 14A16-like n=1 Tax=Apteryx mantelli TaxID=2696672 RepID=A0ABM4F2B3_9AVES
MANSLWNTRAITYLGCAAQLFFIVFFMLAEYCLLTVMSYDRYVAICKPLHYGTIMDKRACVRMAAVAWVSGFLNALLHTGNTFSIPLCQGNTVDQFFCEIPPLLKLSCSDSYLREVGLIVLSVCLGFGCFIFIVLSYVQIFTAVLRIPSEQGRHKAFSTCIPHLAVVSLFASTIIYASLKPPSLSSPALDLVVAVLYSVVPPTLNPLIYSMRNKELKDAVRRLFQWVQSSAPEHLEAHSSLEAHERPGIPTLELVSIPNLKPGQCHDCAGGEFSVLTVMAYDRYVAICRLLHYGNLMDKRACIKRAAAAWIFTAVLRIPSEQGRHKAFSTCLPHLAVLSLFINTDLFAYLKPPSISSPALDLLVAVLYSVLPPTLNPLIYSMRNKELKDALRKVILWTFFGSGKIAIALHK